MEDKAVTLLHLKAFGAKGRELRFEVRMNFSSRLSKSLCPGVTSLLWLY